MFKRSIWAMTAVIILSLSVASFAQDKVGKKLEDEADQSVKAARVLREIMDTPDQAIPEELLAKAECVATFPSVIKAGFIVGGRGGRGVASCRTATGWSAPAYFNLGGGSIGLQIGAEATDFVLLFMNKDGLNSLLSNKFTLGADASVAAGPVGRQAGAETDAAMKAQILSYSRSRGLFAGLELKGPESLFNAQSNRVIGARRTRPVALLSCQFWMRRPAPLAALTDCFINQFNQSNQGGICENCF